MILYPLAGMVAALLLIAAYGQIRGFLHDRRAEQARRQYLSCNAPDMAADELWVRALNSIHGSASK